MINFFLFPATRLVLGFLNLFMISRFTALVVFVSIIGCNDDSTKPTLAEINLELIAGKSGSSKTWILKSYRVRGNEAFEGICPYDNEYIFYNNPSRTFGGSEGVEMCVDWEDLDQDGIRDSNEIIAYGPIIENGYWNLSPNGSIVLISSSDTQSLYAIFSLATPFGSPFPAEIWKINESEFQLRMYVYVGSEYYDIAIEFEVKK